MDNLINQLKKDDGYNRTDHVVMPETVANTFLERIYDSSELLSKVRRVKMPSEKYKIHGIYPQDKQLRAVGVRKSTLTQAELDSEDQSQFIRTSDMYEIKLQAHEYSLTKSVSKNYLDDNPTGQGFGNYIAEELAKQTSVDIHNACINSAIVDFNDLSPIQLTTSGDTAIGADEMTFTTDPALVLPQSCLGGYLAYDTGSGLLLMQYDTIDSVTNKVQNLTKGLTDPDGEGVADVSIPSGATITWFKDSLLGIQNGWLFKLANVNPTQKPQKKVDGSLYNSGDLNHEHFRNAVSSIPKKFLSKNYLWIMSYSQYWKFKNEMMDRANSNLADNLITGSEIKPLGYDVLTVDDGHWNSSQVLFCDPKVLILGIYKDIKKTQVADNDFTSVMQNKRFYNLRIRFGLEVDRPESTCLIYNLNV